MNWWPCCCPTCDIFYDDCDDESLFDDFNRASVGSNWTTVSGTWSISGAKLQTTSSGGIILCAVSAGSGDVVVSARLNGANYYDAQRLIFAYYSSSIYYYARIYWNHGGTGAKLGIYNQAGTLLAETSITAVPGQYGKLTVAIEKGAGSGGFTPDLVTATWSYQVTGTTNSVSASINAVGTSVGFGQETGTVSVDDFNLNLDGWDVISGTWQEKSWTGLSFVGLGTTEANKLIICSTPHPSSTPDGVVSATHWITTATIYPAGTVWQRVRLIANYLDADNYHFAEITQKAPSSGFGNLVEGHLWKRISGTETKLTSDPGINYGGSSGGGYAKLCISGTKMSLNLLDPDPTTAAKYISATISPISGGYKVGFGSGSTIPSSGVVFQSFDFSKHQGSGSLASCDYCRETSPT